MPLLDLLDERACYDFLVAAPHPDGLRCPRRGGRHLTAHRAHRDPVLDYRRRACGRVCNARTGTALQGAQRRPAALVLLLRGIAQGASTARLARALGCSRGHLLQLRHRLQHLAWQRLPRTPLPDAEAGADEMYQDAGKKGRKHSDPDDPPRRRANKRRGRGTFANDRPPVAGVVGRQAGQARLGVLGDVGGAALRGFVGGLTGPGVVLYTDEWLGCAWVRGTGRGHATVCHAPGQRGWARDGDGGGAREVHNNTLEGLRNSLRPFRGVSKWLLGEYVGILQWAHALKAVTAEFIRALVGLPLTTNSGS